MKIDKVWIHLGRSFSNCDYNDDDCASMTIRYIILEEGLKSLRRKAIVRVIFVSDILIELKKKKYNILITFPESYLPCLTFSFLLLFFIYYPHFFASSLFFDAINLAKK